VAVTALASLFVIRRSRGRGVVAELLGPDHDQVVTSDRWGAYEGIPWQRRQLCWAHLRRDFQAMIDRANSGRPVGEALLGASDELFHWWHRKRDGTCPARAYRRAMGEIRERLILLLGRGVRCHRAKTSATCGELLEKEEMLWTFLDAEGVGPTNNAAERALRHAVQWRKASYGTAGESGSRFVATTLSVLMTCRQQGRNLWEYLRTCCRAAQDQRQPPSLLPQAVNA
jgi:transposase